MLIYLQMIQSEEDKSKFEQIYHQYHKLMLYTAMNFLHHRQDAEDAVHHAFVKIAENITKVAEPVCPKTKAYVLVITENTCLNMLKRKDRRSRESLEEHRGIVAEYHGGDVLVGAILSLPPRQRQVILLKHHQGYSLREIAKMLGITYAAAVKAEQRAKEKLEKACREGGLLV